VTPYADTDDLAERFPRALTAAETAQAETMLDDASFLLATKVPGLDAAVQGGDEVIAHAAMLTVVAMTRRSLLAQAAQQNVPGVDQISQTFGPYSTSVKYSTDSGNLWLLGNEFDYLVGLIGGDMSAAVSMRSPGL
jgi:Phage protein Gp19/Gp15/Gp42